MGWSAVALAGVVVGLLLLSYAVWLLATPDYDGGRRPVGAVILVPAAALLAGSLFTLLRHRPLLKGARRAIRAVRLLARDGRIPRPLRWLAVIGLLPIPGPLDEAILLIVAALLYAFYRGPMRDAWAKAAGERGLDDRTRVR